MKKILSLLLATMMIVCTFVPMVSAEEVTEEPVETTAVVNDIAVSGTETTVIKIEDYNKFEHTLKDGTVKQSDVPIETATASDGTELKFLRTGSMSAGSIEQTFRLTAEKTGAYDVSYIFSNVGHLSRPYVRIDGADVKVYKTKSLEASTGISSGYFGSKDHLGAQQNHFCLNLKEGEAVSVTLLFDMSNTGNAALAFAMDDFVITPLAMQEAVEIGDDSVSIEMEKYLNHGRLPDNADTEADESIYVIPASTSNSGTLYALTEYNPGSSVQVAIPVNVKKAGAYDIEMISNHLSGEWMSGIEVQTAGRADILQNTSAYRTEDLSAPATEGGRPTYFDTNYPAGKYGSKVFLNKGQQDIVVILKQRTADSRICAKIDNIKLTPHEMKPVALDKAAETKIEFENYNDAFNTKGAVKNLENTPANQASGGSYLFWDTGARTQDLYGDILVSVPKTGFYDVKLISTAVSGSAPALYVDGVKATVKVGEIFDTKGEDGVYSYFGVAHFGAREATASIYLTEGEHWLTTSITRREVTEGGATFQDVAGLLDYMTFTYHPAPAMNVAAEGTSTLQFEDYVNYTALDNASLVTGSIKEHAKGTILDMTERVAEDGVYLIVPVVIAEDGWYDVKAILSGSKGTWTSKVTISLDGEEVIVNNANYLLEDISKAEDGTIDYVSSDYAMGIYGGGACYLAAGEHEMTLYAKKRSEQTPEDKKLNVHRVCTMLDSFSLTRLEDSATIEGSNVNVAVYFDDVYEGKVITALYAGKQMVGLSVGDIADNKATTTASFTQTPDTVKVFVWKNVDNVEPLVEAKVITLK
ncbi:MAG: hypothetical protein IJC78_03660 [Clostridia bacterium]|nr:hypothetical protein [Clostridia bacterium]